MLKQKRLDFPRASPERLNAMVYKELQQAQSMKSLPPEQEFTFQPNLNISKNSLKTPNKQTVNKRRMDLLKKSMQVSQSAKYILEEAGLNSSDSD